MSPSRLNRWIILYLCLSRFENDQLYEATDLAQWLGIPEKHRLMRYYLNRLVREGYLVRVIWGHRMFYGRSELWWFLRSIDLFEWEGGMRFRVRR